MVEPKTINVDYDGTFDTNPEMWSLFIKEAYFRNYKIYCISQRTDNEENREELINALPLCVEIHLTNHNGKKQWAEVHGIKIDIWIDNNPMSIFETDDLAKQIIRV